MHVRPPLLYNNGQWGPFACKARRYAPSANHTALRGGKISGNDAAVLAALNISDEYFKAQAAAEGLRGQIKGLLEEASDLKLQLSKAKQEIFKLQNSKK